MALDITMDDLIGSMQHSFHAGDRGRDLQNIRDNLAFALAPHAMGPASTTAAQPFAIVRTQPSSSSSAAHYGMVGSSASSASAASIPYDASRMTSLNNSFGSTASTSASRPAPIPTNNTFATSQPASLSSSSGSASYAYPPPPPPPQAPANTPMQTPVDRVAGEHWPAPTTEPDPPRYHAPSASTEDHYQQQQQPMMNMDIGGQRTPVFHQSLMFGFQQAQAQAGAPPNSPAQLVHGTGEAGMEWPAISSHDGSNSTRRLAHLL